MRSWQNKAAIFALEHLRLIPGAGDAWDMEFLVWQVVLAYSVLETRIVFFLLFQPENKYYTFNIIIIAKLYIPIWFRFFRVIVQDGYRAGYLGPGNRLALACL